MRTRLFLASFVSAASLLMLVPFATQAATIDLDSPAQADNLNDPRTVTVIDGKAYVMNHERLQNGTPMKELYVLPTSETPATLLHSEVGNLGDDEYIVQYNGDLYHTVTRARGNTVQVFRSTDDGDTWDQVADVGFASTDIKNQVRGMYVSSGRLYIVVVQKHRYDDVKKRVAIWSSADGDTWKKSVIHWDRSQTLVDATVWNDRPFLLVQGKAFGYTPSVRLYTTFTSNGSKLQQTAETNLSSADPMIMATHFVATTDTLFATGTNASDEPMSLSSSDGVAWDATTHPFDQVLTIGSTMFATSGHSLYYSVDGSTWSTTTFSFEGSLGMNASTMNRVFAPSQDNSGTAIRVWSDDDAVNNVQCWWSADGVSWDQLSACAPTMQPMNRSSVQFGEFWYGIKGKKIHSLYRFQSL